MRILRSNDGEVLLDESFPECRVCRSYGRTIVDSCPIDKKKARHTTVVFDYGEAFDCSKKLGFVKSPRLHEDAIRNSSDLIPALEVYKNKIQSKYEGDYKRLLHNIVSNNAHLIQEVYNLVSEDRLIYDSQQVNLLAQAVSADVFSAAKAFLRIFQSAMAVKTEIATYERLYRGKGAVINKKHGLHRVFMNTAYKFFPDFTDQNIFLRVDQSHAEAWIDYECISIILYHLLDNAKKYALPGREIFVKFPRSGMDVGIVLDMTSLRIEHEELDRIYAEGYTGVNAKKLGRGGTGYGMPVIRELAEKANISFKIRPNVDGNVVVAVGDIPYVRNQFILGLTAASPERAANR